MKSKRLITTVALLALLTLVVLFAYYYGYVRSLQGYKAAVDGFPTAVVITTRKTPYIPENDLKLGDHVQLHRQVNRQVSVLVYNCLIDCNTLKPVLGVAQEMPSVTFFVYYQRVDSCKDDSVMPLKNLLVLPDTNREIWRQFKVQWCPRVYVIDSAGRIAYVQSISEELTNALLAAKNVAQSLQEK